MVCLCHNHLDPSCVNKTAAVPKNPPSLKAEPDVLHVCLARGQRLQGHIVSFHPVLHGEHGAFQCHVI